MKMRSGIAILGLAGMLAAGAGAAGFTPPGDDNTITHVLNRLGYGAKPGDVEEVRRMGVMSFIDRQLHPERIDNSQLEARLEHLRTPDMSPADLAREYVLPAMQERRRAARQAQGDGGKPRQAPPAESMAPDNPVRERRAMMPPQRLIIAELGEQKVLRAVYSERQLEEVLTDFWFNHFNVFAGKGADRIFVAAYEREAIRPHVFGKFRDMLGATARHPAMLFYLDNWMSSAEGERPGRRPRGLNENYARELMELHTLGVDGGYTQEDIVEVAKVFTGWTIDRPRLGGSFRFNPRMHEGGEKRVLGQVIREGGQKEGEQVLDMLARHPSTATFIATKLARRFVSDEPPKPLVDRAAKRFRDTGGDLREVVKSIVTSPEFFSVDAQRAKVKTPFEFVASALRATSADVQRGLGVLRELQQLGMPLYMAQPPTGYADTADAWINTGGLVARMNFAVALSENRVAGVRTAMRKDAAAALELGAPDFQRK